MNDSMWKDRVSTISTHPIVVINIANDISVRMSLIV